MKLHKKQEILDNAERLFNRFGIKKTAVDDIALSARVAKGTIYNYFGNKEGIIREIVNAKISHFEEKVESSIQNARDPLVKMKVALMQRFRIIADTPFLSDRTISFDDVNIRKFLDDMDRLGKKFIDRVLEYDLKGKIPNLDRQRLTQALHFAAKGIEETIKSSMGNISMESIEKDLEFLIMSIFSKYNLGYGAAV